jgi:nitroreductase
MCDVQNKTLSPETLLQQLRWRYATKKFDPARRIPAEEWRALEKALVLAPSSWGLQPWKFVVITDQETKQKLRAASWNQPQVADCSHFVVFAIKKHLGVGDIDAHLDRVTAVRGVPREALADYRNLMVGDLVEGPRSWNVNAWAARQVYLALGSFLTCAALLGIDACPMEGFEPDKYDQILGLARRGLAAAVVCAAGYRADDDKYAAAPKVRFLASEVIERL